MNQWITRWTRLRDQLYLADLGLLALRLAFGGMLLFGHGWHKLSNFGDMSGNFADPLGVGPTVSLALAVFAEVFAAAFVMLGLLSRPMLIVLVINMGVAGFVQHAPDSFNTAEKAYLYFAAFLGLLLTGPGRISLDQLIFGRRAH